MATMRGRRRWLSLLVHPHDVIASSKTRRAVERALSSGALDLLQLRSTENDRDEQVIAAGKILADLVAEQRQRCAPEPLERPTTQLVVNHGSLDVALEIGARGWHLKERFVMGRPDHALHRDLRTARSQNILVGCSVHSIEAAVFAATCGLDYIQVGTMFLTPSHPEKSHESQLEGPEMLRRIREAWHETTTTVSAPSATPLPPLIAVGGINTRDHVTRVMAAGADGVAVIRGILADEQPADAASSYRQWLDHSTTIKNAKG